MVNLRNSNVTQNISIGAANVKFWCKSGAIIEQIRHGPSYSTFYEGIIHSTICEGIIFKFHPLEFVDDIIHSTICEGIIHDIIHSTFHEGIIHSTFHEGISKKS